MTKVLNIAQFIPIDGLPLDNDISLKIYSDLKKDFDIQSEFVKPVGNIAKWMSFLKESLKLRKKIFSNNDYFDSKYNIKIHFYKGTSPFINKIPLDSNLLLPLQFKWYGNYLNELIEVYKPDLLHAHSISPDGYYAYKLSRRFNIPYIITVRGSFYKFYSSKLGKDILMNSKAVTTPSFHLFSNLEKICPIKLIPHGLDESWYNSSRKEYVPGRIRLVTVSRLLEMKNIQTVINVVSKLLKDGCQITYDIIGDGEYLPQLKKLTNNLGLTNNVRFHGYQNEKYIRNIYQDTDIFIMLSYPETFGRSFFEAAAQGLYIIGVENTGAFGHLTENEASFIKIDEMQLYETLKKLDVLSFNSKTINARAKLNEIRNSKITEKYYQIIAKAIKIEC